MAVMLDRWNDDRMDSLAGKVDDLSTQMDWRFEQVDKRFEQVDRRLGGIDERLYNQSRTMVQAVAALAGVMVTGFVGLASLIVATQL